MKLPDDYHGQSSPARTNDRSETAPLPQVTRNHLLETERRVSGGRSCAGCGRSLEGWRPQARFCSDRCRVRTTRAAQQREWQAMRARLDRLLGTAPE
jgi:hypothetical protein